jgi:hypothetical protein
MSVREARLPMDQCQWTMSEGQRLRRILKCQWHRCQWFTPRSAAIANLNCQVLMAMTYGPSSGVTTMDMQQMIDAGIINPNRPRPRPENLGQMRPRPRPASME